MKVQKGNIVIGPVPRSGKPELEDWDVWKLHLYSGMPYPKIASLRGISRSTVIRRINKVRSFLKGTPGLENARDEVASMVPDALNVFRFHLSNQNLRAADRILTNTGVLTKDGTPPENPLALMSRPDDELLQEVIHVVGLLSPGLAEIIAGALSAPSRAEAELGYELDGIEAASPGREDSALAGDSTTI